MRSARGPPPTRPGGVTARCTVSPRRAITSTCTSTGWTCSRTPAAVRVRRSPRLPMDVHADAPRTGDDCLVGSLHTQRQLRRADHQGHQWAPADVLEWRVSGNYATGVASPRASRGRADLHRHRRWRRQRRQRCDLRRRVHGHHGDPVWRPQHAVLNGDDSTYSWTVTMSAGSLPRSRIRTRHAAR